MSSDEKMLDGELKGRPWVLLILGVTLLVLGFIASAYYFCSLGPRGGCTPPFSSRSLIAFMPGLGFMLASMYDFRRALVKKGIGHS